MQVVTGTERTRTEHSTGAATAGLIVSLGLPAVVAVIGIAGLGWDAISWMGAIVWGVVGALGLWLTVLAGWRMGLTRLRLLDLQGSVFTRSGSAESQWTGLLMHCANGALLAVAWAYGVALLAWPANWFTGLLWGVAVWVLAVIFMTSIGAVHPRIREGSQDDPGTAAMNFGRSTPEVYLAAHVVYGTLLGVLYQSWPLA